jgi:hypothetical protein
MSPRLTSNDAMSNRQPGIRDVLWAVLLYATALLVLLSSGDPVAAQPTSYGPWPTTDWLVDCYFPSPEEWYGATQAAPGDGALDDFRKEAEAQYASSNCDDKDEDHSAAGQARKQLRQISQWLESQGFRPPDLPTVPNPPRYRASVVFYDLPWCYEGACNEAGRSGYVPVSAETPEGNGRGENALFVTPNEVDYAHELFHAVQHSFPGVEQDVTPNWILEGTAQAVGLTWASRSRPSLSELGRRQYSERLHRLVPKLRSYDDEVFWRAAARNLTGENSYAFLIPIFEEKPWLDGLAGVDAGFENEGGLAAVYPDVAARYFREDRFYAGVERVEVAMGKTVRRTLKVDAVATAAIRVVPSVTKENAQLSIRIPEQANQEPFRLIVDGMRLDGVGGNRASLAVTPGAEVFVQVANVAKTAIDSREATIPLEIELREMGGWVTVGGDRFEVEPSICNSQGVFVKPIPDVPSVGFSIMAPAGSTHVAWGDAAVSASVFRHGCNISSFPPCRPDGNWFAGGAQPADKPPALFAVDMRYNLAGSFWSGSGILQDQKRHTTSVAFSIQCAPSDRAIIR